MILLGWIHLGVLPPGPSDGVCAAVLDVGQGQAVLVRGPRGCVLVDVGGTSGGRFDRGERIVAPQLARAGCRRIESVVLSHDHDDHAGGAASVLREFEVGELWVGLDAVRRPRTRELSSLGRSRGAALVGVSRGFRARRAGLEIEVLHPGRGDAGGLDVNNRSVVVRLCAGASCLLVAGDLETPGELSLMRAGANVDSGALVVGHHGSPRGTSQPFLAAVHPEVAVISVGAGNRFGHPGADVLRRLREAGVEIHRTDREGLVRLRATAEGWRVETPMRRRGRGGDAPVSRSTMAPG